MLGQELLVGKVCLIFFYSEVSVEASKAMIFANDFQTIFQCQIGYKCAWRNLESKILEVIP